MVNIRFNSFIPRLFGKETVMLFGMVATRKDRLTLQEKAHYITHAKQYNDCFSIGLIAGIILIFSLLALGAETWWLLSLIAIPVFLFYVWYGVEFLVRFFQEKDKTKAKENIKFEKQAEYFMEMAKLPSEDQNKYVSMGWISF